MTALTLSACARLPTVVIICKYRAATNKPLICQQTRGLGPTLGPRGVRFAGRFDWKQNAAHAYIPHLQYANSGCRR